jgi:hypothetical protein
MLGQVSMGFPQSWALLWKELSSAWLLVLVLEWGLVMGYGLAFVWVVVSWFVLAVVMDSDLLLTANSWDVSGSRPLRLAEL